MNLGYHLQQPKHRVLLVDMDPQGSLTLFMGLEPSDLKETIYDSVIADRPLPIHANIHGMDLVPANIKLSGAELELVMADMRDIRLQDALKPVLEQYDFILLSQPTTAVIKILHRMQNETEGKVTHNVMGNSEAQVVQDIFTGLGLMTWESFVKNRLPLLNLPEEVMEALRKGQIAYTKAQVIARVKEPSSRRALLSAAIQEDLSLSQIKERLTADHPTRELPPLKKQMDATYRRLQKAKFWEDPKKRSRLEALLLEMEAILASQ
jgi:MinD-like ATPase involved in chromosome partitioning or flagellar assembly